MAAAGGQKSCPSILLLTCEDVAQEPAEQSRMLRRPGPRNSARLVVFDKAELPDRSGRCPLVAVIQVVETVRYVTTRTLWPAAETGLAAMVGLRREPRE
jgi:hypothetical protein